MVSEHNNIMLHSAMYNIVPVCLAFVARVFCKYKYFFFYLAFEDKSETTKRIIPITNLLF